MMSGTPGVYLRCRLGREWYGINTDQVYKVLQMTALTELPDSGPDVLGLLTLADSIIPVVDMRRRMDLPFAPLRLDTPIVAVTTPRGMVGLVVDEADDLETIDGSQIELSGSGLSPYIVGVAACPDHLLLLMDTSLLDIERPLDVPSQTEEESSGS
jgi:purine-binding chemotaxis protein CheW